MQTDVEDETMAVFSALMADAVARSAGLPAQVRRQWLFEAEAFLLSRIDHFEKVGVGRALPDHLRMAWASYLRSSLISAEA